MVSIYTLTFSHKVNGKRIPYLLEGKEASIVVDAADKSAAIYHADSVKFCETHKVSVRAVT